MGWLDAWQEGKEGVGEGMGGAIGGGGGMGYLRWTHSVTHDLNTIAIVAG